MTETTSTIGERTPSTSRRILAAAREALLEAGFAALSTRRIADAADVPLSQIHYHFGGKEQLILAMLRDENETLLRRQADMFDRDIPLAERWRLACDYLDHDLASGYVRVLHEMMSAGLSTEEVRHAVGGMLDGWAGLIRNVVDEAQASGVDLGPFDAGEIVSLVAAAFLGAESMILLDLDRPDLPIRRALRRVGDALEAVDAER